METEINETEIQRAQAAPPPPPAPPAPSAPAADTSAAGDGAKQAPPAPPETDLPPAPRGEEVAETATESKVMDQNWPFRGYEGPQPWEAENTPELTTNHLMISSGSAGPEVAELADLLARLGYSTSISQGQNPTNTYDTTVVSAVKAFCSEFGVKEDPKVLQARTDDTVGPWIWEAVTRAVYKKAAEDAEGKA